MNDSIYQEIEDNPRFQELVKTQPLCLAVVINHLNDVCRFHFLIAFEPQWLGTPIYTGSSVTRGIPVGVGLIVTSFILTGIYVIRANGEFDRLTAEIIREVKQ